MRKIFLGAVIIFLGLFFLGLIFLPPAGSPTVLMYHFVGSEEVAQERKNFVSERSFDLQMKMLKLLRYRVITMDEFFQSVTGKRKPEAKEVLITFDDGNVTFKTKAFPILKKQGLPSTIFVVSESVKNEVLASMSIEMIRKLMDSGLVTVGSHSRTHPLLSRMNGHELQSEILGSKQDLEKMLRVEVNYFAYPSGDVSNEVVKITREAGYDLAFTTAYKRLKGVEEGPLTITRTKISRTSDNLFLFWIKVSGLYQGIKQGRYEIQRWLSHNSD